MAAKFSSIETYTESDVGSALSSKANQSTTCINTEVDLAISGEIDTYSQSITFSTTNKQKLTL